MDNLVTGNHGRGDEGTAKAHRVLQIPATRLASSVLLCAVFLLGTQRPEASPVSGGWSRHRGVISAPRVLNPGDVLFTDSEATVLRLDGLTGQTSILAAGGVLVRPCGLAVGPDQTVYVTDTGCLAVIAINPATGEATVLSQGDKLGVPFGIVVDDQGEVFVANGQALLRIDPRDGTQRTVSCGGVLVAPLGVAIAPSGELYVADAAGWVVRIEPASGEQTIVSAGQTMRTPVGIVVDDRKTIYVSDATTGRILQVDARTGAQTVTSAEGSFRTPFGLALWGQHDLLVGDPDAFEFAGGIIRVDLRSGAQRPIAVGSGNLVNYRCVAVVPGTRPQP